MKCRFVILLVLALQPVLSRPSFADPTTSFRVLTFNILQGGGNAGNVGVDDSLFDGSRIDEIAAVIRASKADIVGIQEDCSTDALQRELGDGWNRAGSVYSRFSLKPVSVTRFLTVVDAKVTGGRRVRVVNCHWEPAKGYGPFVVQAALKSTPEQTQLTATVQQLADRCAVAEGARGYEATLLPLRAAISAGETVILTGDFNEPSHLDWTDAYARDGWDRWVANPTGIPLRFPIRWHGSVALQEAGMVDSYRAVHQDEVKVPGITWTPEYPENTPGRRPYGEQVLDRIDRIYHHGESIHATKAAVIGEQQDVADVVFEGRWPSDHRAVVVEFQWLNK